ncbi:MAG: GNAT family N-acetyltransferase [bacterium]
MEAKLNAEREHRLRIARPDDVAELQALIDTSVRALSVHFNTPQQIESALRYVFGVDTQLIADETYYVIESGGVIVAAGGWSRRRTLFGGDQHKSADDPELDPTREPARIRAFFVHPAFTRRGLARRLFDECAAAARAHGFASMQLGATLPGQPLYEALGFSAIESIEVPMPDGEVLPVVRMSRDLEIR